LISRNVLAGIFLASSLLSSYSASAVDNSSPIGIDLFPPVQFPNSDFAVNGLRLSLVGLNREARGLDLAILGNITNQTFKGLAIAGLFNYNRVTADIIGFQIACLANINMTASNLYGIQLGAYNKVGKVHGIQLGLINVTHELHGIQIGLINFNEAGPFKASPIINVAF
jgi:hypothetical protein